MNDLFQIHAEIEARVLRLRADSPDWLCGKGCDACCRRLADVPQLTAAEWQLLRAGLDDLAPQRLSDIRRAVAAMADTLPPLVCPLLDQAQGVCPVYGQRPVACRTYGFYVQRELGLYCSDIEARVGAGSLADVVWGNQDAVERQLAGLGERRTLPEWFARWDCAGDGTAD